MWKACWHQTATQTLERKISRNTPLAKLGGILQDTSETQIETVYYTRWTTKRNRQLRVQETSSSGSIKSTYWPNGYYINFKRRDPYVYLCAIRLLGERFRRVTSVNGRLTRTLRPQNSPPKVVSSGTVRVPWRKIAKQPVKSSPSSPWFSINLCGAALN